MITLCIAPLFAINTHANDSDPKLERRCSPYPECTLRQMVQEEQTQPGKRTSKDKKATPPEHH